MLISDQAKDLVKNCVEGGGCMSPFQPLVYIRDLESVDRQTSGMCGWARVTRILCAKHKNASWVFSSGDFVLESLFCAQRLWILNLFSADTELWASRFDWLKDYNFWTFQLLFMYFIAKSCYFCERTSPSIASNNAVIVWLQLDTFNCSPFHLDVKQLKCTWNFFSHVLTNPDRDIYTYSSKLRNTLPMLRTYTQGLFMWARLTGLARLPGWILPLVYMRNFSPVSEMRKGQKSWGRVLAPNSGNKANIAKHKNFNFQAYLSIGNS